MGLKPEARTRFTAVAKSGLFELWVTLVLNNTHQSDIDLSTASESGYRSLFA